MDAIMSELQEKVLIAIYEYVKKYQLRPTISDIAEALGIGRGRVHFHMGRLGSKRFLEFRSDRRARSCSITEEGMNYIKEKGYDKLPL